VRRRPPGLGQVRHSQILAALTILTTVSSKNEICISNLVSAKRVSCVPLVGGTGYGHA
jgi:hypothetical protein